MADVAARLREAYADLTAAGPEPGRSWCRAWTQALDDALEDAYQGLELVGGRLALVAVGGYGRSELCPGSDVDLLLLYDGLDHGQLEQTVRQVVYPLWDAGLSVGHAVRDRRQALAMALDDVDAGTALLDARSVAGDPELVRTTRDALVAKLRRRPDRLLAALAAADDERRIRAGDAAEVLEPDLKKGAGTLRDVQSLRWAAAALLGEPRLDALVAAGYVSAWERPVLARAYDRLLRVRVATHLAGERPTDVLRMDLQAAVAQRLGYEDGVGARDTAADRLLHDVFLDARSVEHVHARAWRLLQADARHGRRRRRTVEHEVDGFGIVDGVLRLGGTDLHDPSLPTRLLRALVEAAAVLDAADAARLAEAARSLVPPDRWADADRRRLLETLWGGQASLPAFAQLDHVGLLSAVLPEWEPLRGRPQRNPFHRFSLDRHALHAATGLGDLVRQEAWAAETLEEVEDRDALVLGALLHDVGKAHGEPHTESGVPVARAVVERLGAPPATVDGVERLVRLHLLLPDVATRRDLADDALIASVAEQVGDRPTLAALHLLAAADGAATGPSAWNGWKASLVETLVNKVRAVFDETHPDELADSAVNTAHAAQRLAPDLGADPDQVRAHLAQLPPRYAATVTPRSVVRHALLTASPLAPSEVRTRVTPGADEDGPYDELDVVALDTPGLFAKVAGVLALHGGSVVAASAFAREDGVAVDTFTVSRPEAVGGAWWARVEGDLAEAVAGRLALRARVAREAAKPHRRPRTTEPIDTVVAVSPDTSGRTTIVEVHTADGTGVLFRITTALAELELDIVVARIATVGHEVVDVFYVRDAHGQPLDEDHAAELRLAVDAALS